MYRNYREPLKNLYSHLSLDKPRYKLGDKINGNIVLGDFNKEYSHNTVVARLSTSNAYSITSKRGLIDEQKIDLDSFGSANFEFQIPEFISGNNNNLYLTFFWDGKQIKSQYLEILKVDKAQTLMSASFDKSFYLLGENPTLNVKTNLYNGEPKGNLEFYSKYFTRNLFAESLDNKIFETDSNGEFSKEFRVQPDLELFENMYAPFTSLNLNLKTLIRKVKMFIHMLMPITI